jgi:hypothetical protein
LEGFEPTDLHRQFDLVNLTATCAQCDLGGGHRAVVLASVVSDAWLHVASSAHDPICCFCQEAHGTYAHLMFECDVPDGAPVFINHRNYWNHRFGWIRSDREIQNQARLADMGKKGEKPVGFSFRGTKDQPC